LFGRSNGREETTLCLKVFKGFKILFKGLRGVNGAMSTGFGGGRGGGGGQTATKGKQLSVSVVV